MPFKAKFDDSVLQAKLHGLMVGGKRLSLGEVVRRHARLCAIELCTRTQPFGKTPAVRKTSERAIERDIRKLYKDHEAVLTMARNWKDTPWQRAVVKALEAEDFNAVWVLLQDTGSWLRNRLVEEPSRETHKRFRNSRGHVKAGKYFEIVKSAIALAKYIKSRKAMVGYTKSVWWSCAEQLKTELKRATDGFPAWVRRHKGPGRIQDHSGNTDQPYVILETSLPWMNEVLPSYQQEAAIEIVRQKMIKYIDYTWKKSLKEEWDKAA